MRRSSPCWSLVLLLAVMPATGCLFRTRPVEDTISKAPLKESSQSGLIDVINQQAATIRSLQATFDMVSNGDQFKLWIPPKNRFVVGRNDVKSSNADQPMENLRPQEIYDALLIRHIDSEHEIAVLENSEEILHDTKGHRVLQEAYELIVIRRKGDHEGILSRKIVFSRTDLRPHRQYIYDDQGKLVTDAHYAEYKEYDGVSFPSRIEIVRPQEEYDITLNVLKMEINKPLRDDQFALEQPPGAVVVNLDHPQSSAAAPPAAEANSKR